MSAAISHAHTQLAEAAQHFLFHLSGHARLPGTSVLRCMRVRVGRKRTVFGRRLVEADTLANPVIQFSEAPTRCFIGTLLECCEVIFLHRQQQLGNHVPVNAPQTFEPEHRAGAAGECLVVKCVFEQLQNRLASGRHHVTVFCFELMQLFFQIAGICEFRTEAIVTFGVAHNNARIVLAEHFIQERDRFDFVGRHAVLLEKRR